MKVVSITHSVDWESSTLIALVPADQVEKINSIVRFKMLEIMHIHRDEMSDEQMEAAIEAQRFHDSEITVKEWDLDEPYIRVKTATENLLLPEWLSQLARNLRCDYTVEKP